MTKKSYKKLACAKRGYKKPQNNSKNINNTKAFPLKGQKRRNNSRKLNKFKKLKTQNIYKLNRLILFQSILVKENLEILKIVKFLYKKHRHQRICQLYESIVN